MTNKAGEQPTITQADRDAAAAYWKVSMIGSSMTQKLYKSGEFDSSLIVQAFARHRTTSLAAQDLVDCETCCGNGEVVTDWERYKHPHDGDVGDEAVADCPDCDGNGKIEVPSLAAQDGLVEALERCAQIVEQWNHRQNEKVDDIKYIVRNALSAIKGDKS